MLLAGRIASLNTGSGGVPKHPTTTIYVPASAGRGPIDPVDVWAESPRYRLADVHADANEHGGRERALSLYAAEHLREIGALFGREFPPGSRGENVTTEGIDYARLRAGDIVEMGNFSPDPNFRRIVRAQLTRPSSPCKTLQALCKNPDGTDDVEAWKRLVQYMGNRNLPPEQVRCGWYATVLEGSLLAAGDDVLVIPGLRA